MKFAALALAGAALLASAAPAVAASPTDRKVAALAKQVKTLQKQVKTLQSQQKFLRNEIVANYDEDACQATAVADLFQSTWTTIDSKQGSSPWFGAQTPVNEQKSCGYISITRPGITTPPAITILQTLINWIEQV